MQEQKRVQNYQPLTKVPNIAAIGFVARLNLPISTGFVLQTTDLHPNQVYELTFIAEHLALGLAQTLSVLEIYDRPAVYRITSILEPYIETTHDPDTPFPPKSSHKVTIKVTNAGRVIPTNFLAE